MVDVEAVYVRCFELAPYRFSWRTHPDLPDFKKCSKSLQEAERRKPSLLIKTGDRFGHAFQWRAGVGRGQFDTTQGTLCDRTHAVRAEAEPRSRMLAELEDSDAYQDWQAQSVIPSEKWKAADFLRCSPDSNTRIWSERFQTLRSAAFAAEKVEMLRFLTELRS